MSAPPPLAELEREALPRPAARAASHVEVVAAHPAHTGVTPHSAPAEKRLEYAVWVDIVVATAARAIVQILSTIVHSSLFLVTKYGVGFTNLEDYI